MKGDVLPSSSAGRRRRVRWHAAVLDNAKTVPFLALLAEWMVDRIDSLRRAEGRQLDPLVGSGWISVSSVRKRSRGWIATGDLLEPDEIGASNVGVFLDAVEMWFDPMATPDTGGFRLRL